MLLTMLLGFSVFEWGVVDARTGMAVSECSSIGSEEIFQNMDVDVRDSSLIEHKPLPAKEPVMYFYGKLPSRVSVRLGLDEFLVMDAMPEIENNKWVLHPTQSDADLIRTVWSDPEASLFRANGYNFDYLFYEVQLQEFENLVRVQKLGDTIKVTNGADYPVYDMMFVVMLPDQGIRVALLKQLDPGETVELEPCCEPDPQSAMRALRELGFTEGAAKAFVDEWWKSFTDQDPWDPSTVTVDNLSEHWKIEAYEGMISYEYRLPQDVIDRLCPITIEPKPERFRRAWWVLIN